MFGAYIVFVLFETILSRSFCVHLHNLHRRIQSFEGYILNVWKCIHSEAIQVRTNIFPYLLSKGARDRGALKKELF